MASYNTVITNEGAALLASVIANQGTLTFSEMRFSTTDYDGVEATLTVGTFAGVFITAAASASVVDSTTIKVDAQFDNSGIVGDHPLYSIGIVGTDGNTTALIAVCTTTNPDIIRAALTGVSTYAFNVNLTVSSTSNITVVGTTAAVLYDTDIVNNLNSTDATKPLSANMGHTLGEEVNAIVNVYGAKNLLPNEGISATSSGVTFTVNDDKSITINADGTNASEVDFYFYNHNNSVHDDWSGAILNGISGGSNTTYQIIVQYRNPNLDWLYLSDGEATLPNSNTFDSVRIRVYANTTLTNVTVKPMIRDARIVDPTYEPFAETNQKLTVNKANRSDLASLNLTGSTNTTGATINAGTYFYLNGTLCIALADIAVNATFTLNTNYRKSSGLANEIITRIPTVDTTKMPTGNVYCYTYGKICMLRIEGATFANDGDGQVVMSDLPKAITLMQGAIGGSSSAETAAINSAGTVAWIQDTNLCVSVGTGDANRLHYIYVVYITV